MAIQVTDPINEEPPSMIMALQLQDWLMFLAGALLLGCLYLFAQNQALEGKVARLTGQPNRATLTRTHEHDKPPVIELAETEARFRFSLGSVEISGEFNQALLHEVIPQILEARKKYGINMIQVIGHTDEVPNARKPSTLDRDLLDIVHGYDVEALPGSNVDLAMLRAVAVLRILRNDLRLYTMKIVPYSAGQVLLPGDTVSSGIGKRNDPSRRRIVIRLTRR